MVCAGLTPALKGRFCRLKSLAGLIQACFDHRLFGHSPDVLTTPMPSRVRAPVYMLYNTKGMEETHSFCINGLCGARTHDIMVVTHALSQLS